MYVIACLFFLRNAQNFWQVLIGLCVVGFAYGGYLPLMPSFTADYFGAKNIGANYGIMFTAWGVCGFIVPGDFAGIMKAAKASGDLAGGYNQVYFTLAMMSIAGAVLALVVKRPMQSVGEQHRNNCFRNKKKGGSFRNRPFSISFRLISYLPEAALLAALSGFTFALATTGASFST